MTNKSRCVALVLAIIGAGLACNTIGSKDLAQSAIDRFHGQFDAGRYSDIYYEAAEAFRAKAKESDIVLKFKNLHQTLGSIVNIHTTGWRIDLMPEGRLIIMQSDTQFSNGNGVEQFTFLIEGNSVKLYNYTVTSPKLIRGN
jgi:hypothetical protein